MDGFGESARTNASFPIPTHKSGGGVFPSISVSTEENSLFQKLRTGQFPKESPLTPCKLTSLILYSKTEFMMTILLIITIHLIWATHWAIIWKRYFFLSWYLIKFSVLLAVFLRHMLTTKYKKKKKNLKNIFYLNH
jgi:hypothetical protein